MSNITDLKLVELVDKIKKKELSSTEVTIAFIERSKKSKKLNTYISENYENAIKKAKIFDQKPDFKKKLPGIPIAVKDLFCTKNIRTTAGSKILENFVPTYESTVTQNILDEGGIIIGKLNCDEFAMGSSNETSYFGNVQNPVSENLVPGGSSGGSSSALAAKLTPATIGTDTGGSIRQPASFTGTVGLKPTYGSCSRYGIVAFASSLDQAGPMTHDVKDCSLMFEIMSTYDIKDSTSVDFKRENYLTNLNENIKGKKIGIPKEYRVDGMPKEIDELWEKGIKIIKENGGQIIEISLPNTNYALPTYYIVAPAEASSNLARYDGVKYGFRSKGENLIDMYEKTRSEGFGDEVKRRIMIGTYVLSSGYYDAYYLKAQKVRRLIKNDFDEAYKKVDAILTPSTPSSAFKIGEKLNDPVSMYLNDIFTVPINLAGLPAISIPAGHDKKGYPLGLQVIGKAFDEQSILNIAFALEKNISFKNNITDWWIK
ncbi:Asp-tRNA(Asn)/Glu-tRNA(Gln) amidotransferase subunit GatA [Candidatus Pelagibacter communis]|uniref:Asp-tRNA(Asn)/Glu-tRNA(Gln) amidotransferase subunit GatA n=1 Tax=Pelagibacter ubique TaxID=198252 RepID=UPI00094D9754|nr:Asp-tRNA(Asn)/Glu-tRNA(Gln) amidotransferase subunit GatA [Candidatus Pelagibacter ubique]